MYWFKIGSVYFISAVLQCGSFGKLKSTGKNWKGKDSLYSLELRWMSWINVVNLIKSQNKNIIKKSLFPIIATIISIIMLDYSEWHAFL